jgi:hypothetical protein
MQTVKELKEQMDHRVGVAAYALMSVADEAMEGDSGMTRHKAMLVAATSGLAAEMAKTEVLTEAVRIILGRLKELEMRVDALETKQ